MPVQLHQYTHQSDNYGVLVHDEETGKTACIDVGDPAALRRALDVTGWALDQIWITHHHADHTNGLEEIKAETGAEVTGPGYDTGKTVAGLDRRVVEGDKVELGATVFEVLHTPGHTLDMLNYHCATEGLLFSGDTLFMMGCGRIFEGTPEMMWESLQKLAALPGDTMVYCSHEYTVANAKFALSVDPDNQALIARAAKVEDMRVRKKATVPGLLSVEFETNPFLRASDSAIRAHLGMVDASDVEVFTEIRKRKDSF